MKEHINDVLVSEMTLMLPVLMVQVRLRVIRVVVVVLLIQRLTLVSGGAVVVGWLAFDLTVLN